MSLLTQCPRCSFNYVRRSSDPTENITCRRCQMVFSVTTKRADAAPPANVAAKLQPIVVSAIPSAPTDFVIEPEPALSPPEIVHEVEHIEVLDEPDVGAAAVAIPPPSPAAPIDSMELDMPALQPLDDVEVIEAAPPATSQTPAPLPVADEVVVDPMPVALLLAVPIVFDPVEVVDDPVLPKERPIPTAFLPEAEPIFPIQQPPPMRRAADDVHLDIRKRSPRQEATPPIGIWLGLGIGFVAILILTLVIVLVLRSGGPTPM